MVLLFFPASYRPRKSEGISTIQWEITLGKNEKLKIRVGGYNIPPPPLVPFRASMGLAASIQVTKRILTTYLHFVVLVFFQDNNLDKNLQCQSLCVYLLVCAEGCAQKFKGATFLFFLWWSVTHLKYPSNVCVYFIVIQKLLYFIVPILCL